MKALLSNNMSNPRNNTPKQNRDSFFFVSLCVFGVVFCMFDIYFAITEGRILKLRLSEHWLLSDNPIFFISTFLVKLVILIFLSLYLTNYFLKRKRR